VVEREQRAAPGAHAERPSEVYWSQALRSAAQPRLDRQIVLAPEIAHAVELEVDFDTASARTPVLPGCGTSNEMCLTTLFFRVPTR
jgi:hypothetical protein